MTNVLMNIATEGGTALLPSAPAPAAPSGPTSEPRCEDALPGVSPQALADARVLFGATFNAESARDGNELETALDTAAPEAIDDELTIDALCATTVVAPVAIPMPLVESAAPVTARAASAPLLLRIATTQIAPPESSLRLALQMTSSPANAANPAGVASTASTPEQVSLNQLSTVDAVAIAAKATRTGLSQSSTVINGEQLALLASQSSMHVSPTFALAADQPIAELNPKSMLAQRQSLAAVLGERLHMQINQRSEHAVIRLDPPSMGSIEIIIRQEAGGLTVQMRASHPEVARQLHAIGDTLRQDLVQRQQGDVSVQVADPSRDAAGEHRRRHSPAAPWQDEPGQALHDANASHDASFALQAE